FASTSRAIRSASLRLPLFPATTARARASAPAAIAVRAPLGNAACFFIGNSSHHHVPASERFHLSKKQRGGALRRSYCALRGRCQSRASEPCAKVNRLRR